MKKIAIINQKGGVGKSTLSVNIAHGLAINNYKVLLVDLDGQNDSSLFLGMDDTKYTKTFFDLIDQRYPTPIEECIVNARKNLDLLPNSNISKIEAEFAREARIDRVLQEQLSELENMDYDCVIIDAGPQRTRINDAVLCYVENIIMPVQVEAASVRATGNIYSYLEELRLDPKMIKLIIPNMVNKRNNDSREHMAVLEELYGEEDMLTEPIYRRVKITEASKNGQTVFEYDKESEKMFLPVIRKVEQKLGLEREV